MMAITEWKKGSNSISKHNISGKVLFVQSMPDQPVSVSVLIQGLPDGLHGFHIHEKSLEEMNGSVEECCDALGGHFNVGEKWSLENQSGTKHGAFGSEERHNGDLCNNIYSYDGFCEKYFIDDKISLFKEDVKYIIGRSIVIHKNRDDMGLNEYSDSKKNIDKFITGNAGKRIACGNIVEKI